MTIKLLLIQNIYIQIRAVLKLKIKDVKYVNIMKQMYVKHILKKL